MSVADRIRGALRARTVEPAATPLGLTFRRRERALNLRLGPHSALSTPLPVDLDIIGAWLSATRERVGFVQIGAFDGRTNDPINELVQRFGWSGVLVEPQPEPFARLTETYAGIDGLVLLNAAVATEPGSMTLWRVAEPRPDDPWWVAQSASFDRQHLEAHVLGRDDLRARITGHEVEAMTLSDVFARSPAPVDVLQIDAEGYDAEVVAMLAHVERLPTVVRFEHRHLSPKAHSDAVDLLAARSYQFLVHEDDTLAVRHTRGVGATAVS